MSILNEKVKEFKTLHSLNNVSNKDERDEYNLYCIAEAKKIFNSLVSEIADDIGKLGKAFVNVIGKYDNIFKYRISNLIKKMFRKEGLELRLFNSIGCIEVSVV